MSSKELIEAGALRQFCHNNGDPGYVAAYDKEITDRVFADLAARSAQAAPPVAPEQPRYYMDHGVLHDRETGQHMWTQDQYDEQWRSMYKAGQDDAAAGFNMLTGKAGELLAAGGATQAGDALVVGDEKLREAIAEGLRGLYWCGRVWSAWGVGTMSEGDFYPADESEGYIEQVLQHIRARIGGDKPAEQGEKA